MIKFQSSETHDMYQLGNQFGDYSEMDMSNVIRLWWDETLIYQIETLFTFKKVKNIVQEIDPNANPSYLNAS